METKHAMYRRTVYYYTPLLQWWTEQLDQPDSLIPD